MFSATIVAFRRRFLTICFCFASVLLTVELAVASFSCQENDDLIWSQFRGNQQNPVVEHPQLPDRWSESENIEWALELPGRGWSSPIIVGNQVFVTTVVTAGDSKPPQTGTEYSNELVAELTEQGLSQAEVMKRVMERDFELPDEVDLEYFLYSIQLDSGKVLWRQRYHHGKPPGGRHRKNSFCSETPITDGRKIYVYSTNVGLFAYDLTGKLAWSRPLEALPIYMNFGSGSSPVLCDDRILIVHDNEQKSFISAFNTETGELIWQVDRNCDDPQNRHPGKSAWVTPCLWKNSLRTEIVTVGPGTAISYNLDGDELWRINGMNPAPAASSLALGDRLILNAGRGKPIYAIDPGAAGDITPMGDDKQPDCIAWRTPRTGTYIPTPLIYQDKLYVIADNGILTCLDLSSGMVHYKRRVKPSGADFTASPWAYGDKIFLASEQGEIFVVSASTEFDLLHTNSIGELIMATPAIAGDRLLIRSESRLSSIRSSN